ncbi:XPC-binding domain [Sesbania bispinosa]|nr:XPC-binding domain [Sesbania bispinosa]
MKVNVKTLKGTHFEIEVNPQDMVADVKKNIEVAQGADVYPAAQQMLIYQGKVLKDTTTLEENKVAENSFMVIMLSKVMTDTNTIAQNRGTKTQQQLKTEEHAATARVCTAAAQLEKTRQKLQNARRTAAGRRRRSCRTPGKWSKMCAVQMKENTDHAVRMGRKRGKILMEKNIDRAVGFQHRKRLKDIKNRVEPLFSNRVAKILPGFSSSWDREDRVISQSHDLTQRSHYDPTNLRSYLRSDSERLSKIAAQPASSLPPTSSTSQPPSSTLGQGESNSEHNPVTTPAATVPSIYGQAASNLIAGSNLESTIQQILEMGGGSWDRDTVIRALRAAFNNPERAVEYLYSGIPEQADVPAVARSAAIGQADNPSVQAPQPAVPTGGPNTNPLNLFPQGIPNLGTNENAGDLDFLRNSQQFQALRAMVQANPQILQNQLASLVQMPQTITVTPEEQEAIQRVSY